MFKTKPLRPAFREKKRYLVYKAEVLDRTTIPMRDIQRSLLAQLNTMLGIYDSAGAGILPVKYDATSYTGIFRVNHQAVDKIKASFALIDTLEHTPVRIRSVGVSGILKKAKERYFS